MTPTPQASIAPGRYREPFRIRLLIIASLPMGAFQVSPLKRRAVLAAAWGASPAPLAGAIATSLAIDSDSAQPHGMADRGARLGSLSLLGITAGLLGFSALRIPRRSSSEEHVVRDHRTHGTVIDGTGERP